MTSTYLITLETVRDKWKACYPADKLAALGDRPQPKENEQ